ncbi:hypothetical protein RJ640_006882 [Escallonia rubra]|uniref:CUE domain-containing protein n=1 Tax=Escallonia rubra TaxID=112253 RepID=A0AA88UHX7_9ASTE|nr:hypothetical protein RJ640_006882 [Escallonia rubra]
MSNRYTQNRPDGTRNFARPQQKFVPKMTPVSTPRQQANITLSNSLRQSQSDTYVAASSSGGGGGAPASTAGARAGENGAIATNSVPSGNFVNYLPQDEAVAAGLGADEGGLDPVESQRVVDLLNRELSRDTSLHAFLESFLKFKSRWYDFPYRGARGIVAGVIVGEFELSRRVFMLLYRIDAVNIAVRAFLISSFPDVKFHIFVDLPIGILELGLLIALVPKIMQEKKLIDLPKVLDICAIYGHENEDLTRILVVNSIKAQPRIHNDLTGVLSRFLSIVHTMHHRCSSSLEIITTTPAGLRSASSSLLLVLFSSHDPQDHGSSRLYEDYLEVMDFINDAIVSMDAFVSAYKHAAAFFSSPVEMSYGNEELLNTLAKLHDSLLPSLHRGFRIIFTGGEDGRQQTSHDMLSDIAVSLKMLSMRIVKFGWKLLYFGYLSDEVFEESVPLPAATKIFPANVEDPVIRADILVQTLRELSKGYPEIQEGKNRGTFLQNVEKKHKLMSRIELLRNSVCLMDQDDDLAIFCVGWILMDDEQFQFLSGIMMHPSGANTNASKVGTDDNNAIIDSKISQIRDLFPDYGNGFLSACLEVYNQNPEEVIQRILEGTLHKDLQSLDPTIEKIPPKPASLTSQYDKGKGKLLESTTAESPPMSASLVNRYDKGKGKLLESSTVPSTTVTARPSEQEAEGPSLSSTSSAGRYVRKSRTDLPDSQILDHRDEKDMAKTAALISQLEYEDEYDDSFDDLGLTVADSGLEETEILHDKLNSNGVKSWGSEAENSPSNAPKWNSRQKPQFFVKDGKNYSYKVSGSVGVANYNEASLVNQSQKELIHGLGRGGNLPLGAVHRLSELSNKERVDEADAMETAGQGNPGHPRGRGRGGGRNNHYGRPSELSNEGHDAGGRGNAENFRGRGRGGGRNYHYGKPSELPSEEQADGPVTNTGGRGNAGNSRGGGRRGGRNSHYRKDQAMKKHFSGLSGI